MSTPVNGIGGIGGQPRVQGLTDTRWRELTTPAAGAGFGDVLSRALAQVDGLQVQAHDAIGAFVRGEPVELHQVMAAAEEAGLALELLVELRNKVTEAYRSVMSMQS
jgi:flagellar hook-basal body complex protein FliE